LENIRLFDKDLTEVGIFGTVQSAEYSRRFREPGKIRLLVRDGSFTASRLEADTFLRVPEGDLYIVTSVERDPVGGTVEAKGVGILSLFGRTVIPEEYSLDGEVSALLLGLARRGAELIPGGMALGDVLGGAVVHFDGGRRGLLSDMESLCHAGGIGMDMSYDGETFHFTPKEVRDRTGESDDPVILSGKLGTLRATEMREDFSSYYNVAVVSGAEDGHGGRYTAVVRWDEVDFSDTFPDGEHGERQMLVNFTSPTSAYTVDTAAGVEQFDRAAYEAAMRSAGAAALGRCRPGFILTGETSAEVDPGDLVRVNYPDRGISGDAVAEEVRICRRGGEVTRRVMVKTK